MSKKQNAHQRLIASAKRMLAAQHAASPVPAYNSRTAKLDQAAKRARRGENAPTPEQEAKADYVEADVNEYVGQRRVNIGRAYRRRPRFETVEAITIAQLFALRRYRSAFDTSERSETKSCLDIGPGGGGMGGAETALSRLETLAVADHAVRRMEVGIGSPYLEVLRLVALHDHDFKSVALGLYGSTSGQRRQEVRDLFLHAAALLTDRPRARAAAEQGESSPIVPPAEAGRVHPAFLNDRGLMRPLPEIASIIRNDADGEAID